MKTRLPGLAAQLLQEVDGQHADHRLVVDYQDDLADLVEFGLLSMTKVTGGHGTGTQWHLDLINPCLVDALQPLAKRLDGTAVEIIDGVDLKPTSSEAAGSAAGAIDRAKQPPRRRAARPAPRSRA